PITHTVISTILVTLSYLFLTFSLYSSLHRRALHSFPTRRSSDLGIARLKKQRKGSQFLHRIADSAFLLKEAMAHTHFTILLAQTDRKSTRLNSSHRTISYAVFCLKKKKKHPTTTKSK